MKFWPDSEAGVENNDLYGHSVEQKRRRSLEYWQELNSRAKVCQ